jgi:chemotaxis signal transduction protein
MGPADDDLDRNESAAITRIESLLEERARKIAQPEEGHPDEAIVEVLKFRLAYQEYAIEMQYIREVILTGEITPVPGTPDYISGICMVRGEIISLVDLRVLLSIPERGLTDLNRVIVLTDHNLTFGILADHITGIGVIELNLISTDKGSIPVKHGYVKGMAGGSLFVLDAAAIFSDPKMIIEDD